MSVYTPFTWLPVNLDAVCALQNVASPGALILNGQYANNAVINQISFITENFTRNLSFTSANDLSAATFVVTGFQNGAPVTESITGVNNNTVYGAHVYDQITSITVNQAVNGIRVGTGDKGYLPLIPVNTTINYVNYSVQTYLPPSCGINYSLLQALTEVNFNYVSFDNQLTKFFPAFNLTNITTSQFESSQNITNYLILKVNSSATPLTDTFDFVFLQT